MDEKNTSQEFGMKNTNETRNYFIEKINLNKLMIKKHKTACTALNYIEQLLILIYVAARSVSISAYASLIGIPLGIVSSTLGLKIYSITAEVKI